MNKFFVNIAARTRLRPDDIMDDYSDCYDDVHALFDFTPPVLEEIYGYII